MATRSRWSRVEISSISYLAEFVKCFFQKSCTKFYPETRKILCNLYIDFRLPPRYNLYQRVREIEVEIMNKRAWAEKNIKVYVKLFHEGKISKEVYTKAVDKMYKIIEKN